MKLVLRNVLYVTGCITNTVFICLSVNARKRQLSPYTANPEDIYGEVRSYIIHIS